LISCRKAVKSLDAAAGGRVNVEDEALEFSVSMPELERLSERLAWIELSFVKRERTPSGRFKWASDVTWQVCHFGMVVRF